MRAYFVIGIVFLVGCEGAPTDTVSSNVIQKKDGLTYYQNELYSGYVLSMSESNDTVEFYKVFEGKMEGNYVSKYPDGSVNELRYFKDNRRNGFHQKWYPDGKKAFEYHYENGVYVDTLKEWYPNGQLYLISHYSDGQQTGRQQAWKQNGELYLNYDVVNGRKYGNAGIKHCKSLWNEVVSGN